LTLGAFVLLRPVLAEAAAAAVCASALLPPVRAFLSFLDATAAGFASVLPLPMLAEAAAAAVFASALLPPMLAQGAAVAVFAYGLPLPMLAEGAAVAVLASALPPPMLAEAAAAAVFAFALLPPVRAFLSCFLDSIRQCWLRRPRLLQCLPGIGALGVQVRQSDHIPHVFGHQAKNAPH